MDSQWLKTQFKLNPEKTKAGLAKMLGLEPPAVSKILKDMRQIKAQEYANMRRYFNLPVDGEKTTHAENDSFIVAPLNHSLNEQEDGGTSQSSNWVIPASIMNKHTQAKPENIKIFTIKEHLMEPVLNNGEHVLVDLSQTTPSPPGTFIVSDGFNYLVRQCEIITGSTPTEIKVSTINTNFTPQTLKLSEFHIIGRVIAKLQWL